MDNFFMEQFIQGEQPTDEGAAPTVEQPPAGGDAATEVQRFLDKNPGVTIEDIDLEASAVTFGITVEELTKLIEAHLGTSTEGE